MADNREIKIEVKNLTKYFGSLHVLDDISFNVHKGEFLCVVGPTGCGKTTFLNLLTQLIPPTKGEILVDGVVADPKVHNLTFVFQEPSAYPWLTVQQNLEFGLRIKHTPENIIKERVDRICDLMGLDKFRDAFPHQLSVSTEQRIVIGRSFAIYPDLLLMDEPYGQMDIKMRYYLEDEVLKLWKEFDSTVIFITHNIEEAVYLAERILILTNKPAKVREEVIVDIPRPRDFTTPEFVEIRRYVTDKIKWW
ncbi:MAG: ABC transporter ATP-binding protein [Eubacteriales bacterium]